MSIQFNQAAQEGMCLRYPDNIPPQREISYETALSMLLRGTQMAQTVPFSWGYVDKPMDGTILLLFLPANAPYPIDGIRYQESEVKYTIPAGPRELEVYETKYGFIPGTTDNNASRVRRRYRIIKGGNPSLVLVHYTRGPLTHIQPNLASQPIRAYPLRPINEPAVFVAGEKQGQKVYSGGPGTMHGGGSGPSNMQPGTIGIGMPFNQQQAMLAQQNSTMEALERRRQREQQMDRAQHRNDPAGGRPPPQRVPEEDDSGDEVDQISTRTLALARYKRNHDWMNDVFLQAAFGKTSSQPKSSPYSIFSKIDLEEKAAKLRTELDDLQSKADQRRANKIRESQTTQEPTDLPTRESITV